MRYRLTGIIRPHEWMEIAKNSRKRMCGGGEGEGEAEFGVRRKEVYIGPTVPLWQSQEPTPVAYYCTDVCSINECERNGRMYGTVILQ